MNYSRIVLAGVVATIVDLAYGFLVYGMLIAHEYAPYSAVYRSSEEAQSHLPLGLAGIFIAILVAAIIYAKGYEGKSGLVEGARFGLLLGIFVLCYSVGTNYATLNISARLALVQALVAIPEWILVGIAIGLVYKPKTLAPSRTAVA